MRLTLRTMLAYLDDILDPKDAEELSKKIEESKFASELVHRIRNCTRRLRLGAPKLEGRGMGLDPNTVAEYLDNTLPAEHVPDFERVCLESDVHLAEAASCHQILTLVLGEPAEVPETLRDRMYQIGRSASEEVTAASAEAPSRPGMAAPPTGPRTTKSELRPSSAPTSGIEQPSVSRAPEGTVGRRSVGSGIGVRGLAIMLLWLLGGFLTAFVALRALGPFGPKHPVWQLLAGDQGKQVAQGSRETERGERPEAHADSAAAPEPSAPVAESRPASQPAAPVQDGGYPPPAPSPPPVATPPAEKPAEKMAPEVPSEPGSPAAKPPSEPAGDTVPPTPAAATGVAEGEKEKREEKPSPRPAPAATVGRSISEEHILGRLDATTGSWFRLPPDSPIAVNDQLMSFPAYRPQILLVPNVKMTFSGETKLRVAEMGDPDTPHLCLEYGRAAVVASMADLGAQIRLDFGDRSGVATLADPDSELAVEVIPYLPLGTDPLATAARRVVRMYAVVGQITWSEGATSLSFGSGQVLQLIDDKPGEVLGGAGVPAWVDGRDLSDIDRLASMGLRQAMVPERPLSLSLAERAEFRQVEVRALACRCLACLDLFEPLLRALNDESQRAYWPLHVDALRMAVARNQESASRLLKSLEALQPDDANRLFRLLWGYSPPQLEEGGAKELVELLEHKTMIARVLAIETLRRITDKTFLFRPEQPPAQEKGRLTKWRRSLEAGEIRYKSPPPAFPALPAGPARTGPRLPESAGK